MGAKDEEELNYGSFMDDRYVPTTPKVCKLSSSIPENLTASFQNLLNKRINDNYKVRKRQNLTECFTILKFIIIFIIFITTCKIITLFFDIEDRVDQFANTPTQSQKTVRICFYTIFTFALIVQFVESYAIVFDNLCLTIVFTTVEFVIILLAMFDNYHSKDEHWLIYLWVIGLAIFIVHLMILYRMKFRRSKNAGKRSKCTHNESDKEPNLESDQLYVPQQDCSYSDFLTQKQFDTKTAAYAQPDYVQTTIDIPTIVTISQAISSKDADTSSSMDANLVKFVDDEEEAHVKRERMCKELLEQCQMKIKFLEMSQCNNQLILDQQQKQVQNQLNDCDCDEECVGESNATSEFNSPKMSSSSCSDETCRERLAR